MARKPGVRSSSGIYHIILRGINRQSIFEDEEDRLKLIGDFAKYKEISQCQIFAYCFMDNHIHILLGIDESNIRQIARVVRLSSTRVWKA